MPRRVIPHDPQGYMVVDSTIHTRYATHVERGMRYRTVDEAFGAVAGTAYAVCGTCYPSPAAPRPSRQRAQRAEAPEQPADPTPAEPQPTVSDDPAEQPAPDDDDPADPDSERPA